jgi:hypothetical protein
LLVAKAIVQAVQQQDPPGRFLERAHKKDAVWLQITYKRAVEKTSQALREKDTPTDTAAMTKVAMQMGGMEAFAAASASTAASGVAVAASAANSNNLQGLTSVAMNSAGMNDCGSSGGANGASTASKSKKRKAAATFVKPSWWNQGTPIATGAGTTLNVTTPSSSTSIFASPKTRAPVTVDGIANGNKKMKVCEIGEGDDPLPPSEELMSRQSSMFRFLSGSGIFGSSAAASVGGQQQQLSPSAQQTSRQSSTFGSPMGGLFRFSRGQSHAMMGRFNLQQQQQMIANAGLISGDMKPAAVRSYNLPFKPTEENITAAVQNTKGSNHSASDTLSFLEDVPTIGLFPSDMSESEAVAIAPPPPARGLTAQMSDWLNSFFSSGEHVPATQSPDDRKPAPDLDSPIPPPPLGGRSGSGSLSRSVSSAIFGLVETPSQLLTSLKTGITSMFASDPNSSDPLPVGGVAGIPPVGASVPVFGKVTTRKRQSLIDDDDDESPMETKLRTMRSS